MLPEQPHENIQDEQVNGIEGIKEVFGYWALDEATLTIVEIDRDKGQTRYPTKVQEAAANGCLKDTVIAQHQ